MEHRILIADLGKHTGETVMIEGSVDGKRSHGKLVFFDIRDRSGSVQAVALPNHGDVLTLASEISEESTLALSGVVNKRPEKMVTEGQNGDIELEITKINVYAEAETLPFTGDAELNLDTLFDHRPLTVRRARERAIFKVQSEIIRAFREFLTEEEFVEIQTPKIVGDDAEGGAGVFRLDYFNDKSAYLATSPQLYKQIMVGAFERVFSTGTMFRAEKHSTSRHLNELAMLDFEMGFIQSHEDVMQMTTRLMRFVVQKIETRAEKEMAMCHATLPSAPETFPQMKLREAQKLISEETGVDCTNEPDLEPEHERWLSEYAKKTHDSDFLFITHYPVSKRPFYTMEDVEDMGYTKSFDLLFRGVELLSGSQRVHDYVMLREKISAKGLDPEKFSFYLEAFKFGMPPHGGVGIGLERFTQKMLGLHNVKEASLFPRDMNRIDTLLHERDTDNE